ncbi:hypothetical protein KFL_000740160 [Klebsormidium nitens]|uniref:Trichome birefringence-like C-terminal domain-containing protein n=1 Tax=Klebsormidium nitens TaxID=105231 RepID=A0A1Y1HRF1_KLENI|nr:hypothetical protein KFL_000740160 [Klebsormidium nitens]|eukprot:GAQ81215.1 hypothetical protein KFL_000740160 [Klebsormidium nitens]
MAQLSINRTGHLGKLAGQAHWFVRDGLKFRWDTESQDCPMLPVNRTNFCHLIGPGQRILVLGDSMSEHFAVALKSHLHWTFGNKAETRTLSSNDTTCTPARDLCADVFLTSAHDTETVKFVRSDQLGHVDEGTLVGNTKHEPWLHELTPETKLVILNQGLHIQKDGDHTKSLTAAIRLIRSRLPHALVIFRSTSIGHLSCEMYEGPLALEQSNDQLPYGWDNVRRQNEIAKKIAADLGVVYMDVMRMTALRPDSHLKPFQDQDCLHYCVPGPLDAWVSVLYNLLLANATLA